MRVLSVFGTRPEAVKMAPVVAALARRGDRVESLVCVTAQHRDLLDQVLRLFRIAPDLDLDLMEPNQTPAALTARAMTALTQALDKAQPDVVLVQGDTTTAMVAGLAAFYQQVPVGHVEAGLRTRLRYSPFPEEMNRKLLGALASLHFAPTRRAAAALRAEGVDEASIFVTGNTVIDALQQVAARPPDAEALAFLGALGLADAAGERPPVVLMTAHRRESFGEPLARICRGVRALVERNPGLRVVYPVHPNPSVVGPVTAALGGVPGVHLVEPLPYGTLVHLMARCHLILTDSGGLQEEGPALGKPVLVLREETERPEAVEAGTARVVGTDEAAIVREAERLLRDPEAYRQMACAVSPYGDGHAAERIADILLDRVPGGARGC